MRDALCHRTVIIGNSGSGKSTLAAVIAAFAGGPGISLDDIYWADQAALKKRAQPLAIQMAKHQSLEPTWVIEGVYGWLVDVVTPRATALVWLDLPWADCRAGLEARGRQRGESAAEFTDLLGWAQQYWSRQTPSSHAGHRKIFDPFPGQKITLRSRDEVAAFLSGFADG